MSEFRRRLMMCQQESGGGGGDLPAGYVPCEHIYTDGYYGYIESGLTPLPSMSYKWNMTLVWAQSDLCTPFGYILNSARYAPFMLENNALEVNYNNWYKIETYQFIKIIELNCESSITQTGISSSLYNPDGTLYKSYSYSYDQTGWTPSDSFALLGRKNSSSAIANGSWRGGLGRLKCYSDDHYGMLVADFRPCYYNGYFGFYEAVSGVFKYNPNSTTGKVYGFGEAWNTSGFIPNARNETTTTSSALYMSDWRGGVVSAMYEVPSGCTTIQFNAGNVDTSGNTRPLMFFKSDKTYRDYFYYNSADRVITVPSDSKYVRLAMTQSLIDTCYIYDVTNGQYIWKGINASIPTT